MQIIIVQSEIESAIRDFVKSQINISEGMEITISLKAGRGDDGYSATIDITPQTAEKQIPATPAKRELPKAVAQVQPVAPVIVAPEPEPAVEAGEPGQTAAPAKSGLFANLGKPTNTKVEE